jgi:hypothetical protein
MKHRLESQRKAALQASHQVKARNQVKEGKQKQASKVKEENTNQTRQREIEESRKQVLVTVKQKFIAWQLFSYLHVCLLATSGATC